MALAQKIRTILIITLLSTAALTVVAAPAFACVHEMEAITPEENAVYMAEWRIEQRHYRHAIKILMAHFGDLPDRVNALDPDDHDLNYNEERAAMLLATAVGRSEGKWNLSKKANKASKKKRNINLAWALNTVKKVSSGVDGTLPKAEIKFALGHDIEEVKALFEEAKNNGMIYESKAMETYAAVLKQTGKAEEAKAQVLAATESHEMEKQTPKPDYEVEARGESEFPVAVKRAVVKKKTKEVKSKKVLALEEIM